MAAAFLGTGWTFPIKPDPAEVSEWKWISYSDLVADMRSHPEAYTVWFRQYVDAHGDMLAKWIGAGRPAKS